MGKVIERKEQQTIFEFETSGLLVRLTMKESGAGTVFMNITNAAGRRKAGLIENDAARWPGFVRAVASPDQATCFFSRGLDDGVVHTIRWFLTSARK